MKEKYAVVMTTCSNLKEAQVIIDALLADRPACAYKQCQLIRTIE